MLHSGFGGSYFKFSCCSFISFDTGSALAAYETRSGHEEEGRSHQQENCEAGKNPDDLSPVKDDGEPRVTQFALTFPGVVVSQQEVVVKADEAVPAEDVLTPLAHHLSAARVPLYWHGAHRTSLDVLSLHLPYPHAEVSHLPALLDKEGPILGAGEAGVPAGRAEAAELLDTGGAGDGHALGLGAGTDVADGVTPSAGAPRTVCVQGNFCV